jgi:cytochrome c peroxidase
LHYSVYCVHEYYYEEVSALDSQLLSLIDEKSNGIGPYFFQLPDSNDYIKVPQDPLNPITTDKVALGKISVHDKATVGGNVKNGFGNRNLFIC